MVEARRIVDAGNDRGLGYLENTSVATATLSSQRQYFKRPRSVESHAHMHKRAHFAPPVTAPAPRPCRRLPRLDEDGSRDRLSRPSGHQHLCHRPGGSVSQQTADPEAQREGRARRDHPVQGRLRRLRTAPRRPGPRARRRHLRPRLGLYIDVMANIDKVLEHTKSLRWRLRAHIGKPLRWYNEIGTDQRDLHGDSPSCSSTCSCQRRRVPTLARQRQARVFGTASIAWVRRSSAARTRSSSTGSSP